MPSPGTQSATLITLAAFSALAPLHADVVWSGGSFGSPSPCCREIAGGDTGPASWAAYFHSWGTYFLTGAEVFVRGAAGPYTSDFDISIYSSTDGPGSIEPGSLLATLGAGLTASLDKAAAVVADNPSQPLTLQPNSYYWLVLTAHSPTTLVWWYGGPLAAFSSDPNGSTGWFLNINVSPLQQPEFAIMANPVGDPTLETIDPTPEPSFLAISGILASAVLLAARRSQRFSVPPH